MRLNAAATEIDPVPGGAFVLFGDYILGRTVELVMSPAMTAPNA